MRARVSGEALADGNGVYTCLGSRLARREAVVTQNVGVVVGSGSWPVYEDSYAQVLGTADTGRAEFRPVILQGKPTLRNTLANVPG